jgi:gamma-glutamyltranspeptidase/glutathione hydrolase
MHTIIPGMLAEGGRITMPFGVMGGSFQPCGHARLVTNLRDFGMDLQTAIDAPRCFADADGLRIETGYDAGVRDQLAALGHRLRLSDEPLGGAQAIILHPSGVLEAGSDPRKDGCALGY